MAEQSRRSRARGSGVHSGSFAGAGALEAAQCQLKQVLLLFVHSCANTGVADTSHMHVVKGDHLINHNAATQQNTQNLFHPIQEINRLILDRSCLV